MGRERYCTKIAICKSCGYICVMESGDMLIRKNVTSCARCNSWHIEFRYVTLYSEETIVDHFKETKQ